MKRYFRRNAQRSWHDYAMTTRAGWSRARCGYQCKVEPEWSDELPVNEASCNRCLALTRSDQEDV